jgi:hypothetical protein
MESVSHSHNISVFLIDDELGDWFDCAFNLMQDFTANIYKLNKIKLGAEKDGERIIEIFANQIKTILQNSDSDLFYVITDSVFGIDDEIVDAGSKLLHHCNSDEQLKNKFGCGVVYSRSPRGIKIKDKIEFITHSGNLDYIETDMLNILDFFRYGKFMSMDGLYAIIKAFGFLRQKPSLLTTKGEQDTTEIFPPVSCYGQPMNEQHKRYLCDVFFVSNKNISVIPFSPESLYIFQGEVYNRFVDLFKQDEKSQAYFVLESLCPYTSMKFAAKQFQAGNSDCQTKGAIRFLWDIVMSGNDSNYIKRDQYTKLKNGCPDPQNFDNIFETYCKALDHFKQKEGKREAFHNLWNIAAKEYDCITDAVYIVFE